MKQTDFQSVKSVLDTNLAIDALNRPHFHRIIVLRQPHPQYPAYQNHHH